MTGPSFTFAVLTDTHVRLEPVDAQSAFPSDRIQNDRNRRAIRILTERKPEFIVHLGDVTHTLPCLATHRRTQEYAKALFAPLPCPMVVAPGNHDVGDKLDSTATVPRVDAHSHEIFEAVWGPSWRVVDHGGCRFILLDGKLIGSGLARERAMWAFLEDALRGAARSFLFLHEPPFICAPDEPSHYDNLAPEARARLLALAETHVVEAIFSGHAHTFFYNRVGRTELYTLPSTAFTRPEYAELFPLGPVPENGRDDADKLGFFLVRVDGSGHRIEYVRTGVADEPLDAPPLRNPVGVWLRGGWARTVDLPHGDLDEFCRKTARNDQPLLCLWEMGIPRVRIPISDLADPVTSRRLRELGARFPRLLVASVGLPSAEEQALTDAWADRVDGWEIILSEADLPRLAARLAPEGVPVALSLLPDEKPDENGYFSHFQRPGFSLGSPVLARLGPLPSRVTRLSFRIPAPDADAATFASLRARVAALGLGAVFHVEMPRGDEVRPPADPDAAVPLVARVSKAARDQNDLFFLDTFEDKDRGYHPRYGLVDRRGNPRPAARLLARLASRVPGDKEPTP